MAASNLTMQKSAAFAGRAVAVRQTVRVQSARVVTAAAAFPTRPNWLPGSKPPAYLDGSQPGDFGFDPLGLGRDPQALAWYTQAELIHCRTAMTAVAGILIPSVLNHAGILNIAPWYDAGKVAQDGSPIPFNALLWVQFVLTHFVETKRWQDIRKPGSQAEKGSFLGFESALEGKSVGYPGGPFNPLGLAEGNTFAEYQWKEIRNGRLAMVAFLGFAAQYVATGKDPIDNLLDHLANPWAVNFTTNGTSLPTNFPFA